MAPAAPAGLRHQIRVVADDDRVAQHHLGTDVKRPPPGTRDGCLALGGQVSPGPPPAPEPDGSEEERARWEAARIAAALAARPGRGGRQVRVDVAARASVGRPGLLRRGAVAGPGLPGLRPLACRGRRAGRSPTARPPRDRPQPANAVATARSATSTLTALPPPGRRPGVRTTRPRPRPAGPPHRHRRGRRRQEVPDGGVGTRCPGRGW